MSIIVNEAISHMKLSGYKSIKSADIELSNLNVFIGANGSGKSNFISFFQLMDFYLSNSGGLSEFVGRNGGAHSLVHFGTAETDTIKAEVTFRTDAGENLYGVELGVAIGDKLYFKDEKVGFSKKDHDIKSQPVALGSGGSDSRLLQLPGAEKEYEPHAKTIKVIKNIMQKWCFYQFHDTTKDARIRAASHINDNGYFRSDAGNLASFLYMVQEKFPSVYQKIVETVKLIAPYIHTFRLEKEYSSDYIRLKWSEKEHGDYFMDASQMSDGTLRAMALVTLLMQPQLPPMICIDEPELGLHPAAISIIGDLIKIAAGKTQIILSTQSAELVDCFEPEDIIVVDRQADSTRFKRLNYEQYKVWFDEYTISETWKTNIFGGQP